MADAQGWRGLDIRRPTADEDGALIHTLWDRIGAVVGGANKTRTIEEGDLPYGGMLKVPVYLMTHNAQEPVVEDALLPLDY